MLFVTVLSLVAFIVVVVVGCSGSADGGGSSQLFLVYITQVVGEKGVGMGRVVFQGYMVSLSFSPLDFLLHINLPSRALFYLSSKSIYLSLPFVIPHSSFQFYLYLTFLFFLSIFFTFYCKFSFIHLPKSIQPSSCLFLLYVILPRPFLFLVILALSSLIPT